MDHDTPAIHPTKTNGNSLYSTWVSPSRVALWYFTFGLCWICLSDTALAAIGFHDSMWIWAGMAKGVVYVALSAGLVFWLTRRETVSIAGTNNLLRAVTESTSDAVFVKDLQGRYLLLNSAAAHFVGQPPERVLGRDDSTFFDAAGAAMVRARDRRVMETGHEETLEEELFAAGMVRTFLSTKAPYRDEHGRLIGMVGISRDITDRKRAERSLRLERDRLAKLAETSPALLLSLRRAPDGAEELTFSGRAACELLGDLAHGPPGDLMRAFEAMIHPLDIDRVRASRDESARTMSPVQIEFRVRHSQRGEVWINSHSAPVQDSQGNTIWHGFLQDVTERKLEEHAVRDSEARLRLLIEHAPASLAMFDRDMRYLYASRRWLADYGLENTDVIGASHYEIFPDLPERWREVHRRALAGEVISEEEDRFERADGSVHWLRWQVHPWHAADGSIAGIAIFSEDITTRKLAEAALRESEAKFRSVFEHAATGIAITDLSGKFIQCNPAYCDLLGYQPHELRNLDFASLIHPDDKEDNLRKIQSLLQARSPSFEIENRYRHKEGGTVWVRKFVSILPDQSDAPAYFVALVTNITQSRRTEQALRESEGRFRTLVSSLPDAVYIVTDGRVVFCNPACVRLLGAADPSQVLGKSMQDLHFPRQHEAVQELIASLRDRHTAVAGAESEIVRLDGKRVPVYLRALRVNDRGQEAILVVLHDLSERKRVQIQLHDQEMLLREAAELAHVGGWGFDPVTLEADWTPEISRIYDLDSASPVMGEMLNCFSGDARKRLEAALEAAVRDGAPSDLELEMTSVRGTRKWVRTICRPVAEDGRVVRVRGSLQDISERKRLELQFQQAQKMEALGRLAAGVAHDFNNLLTVINGYADMLLTSGDNNPRRPQLAAIRDAGERAAALTSQLLSLSRQAILTPRILDLNEVILQSEKLLRRLIGEDIFLESRLEPSPCRILADPTQLNQVIMNLAVNARDAMPTGGRLTMQTRRLVLAPNQADAPTDLAPGRYVELTVRDTGCGMSDEVKARLFEPFFTTKEPRKGTGLGLAVVHTAIQQARGHIGVESSLGHGASFRILIPEATVHGPAENGSMPPPRSRGSETILLVEDEDAVRTLCRAALEAHGYSVLTAASGPEALSLLESKGPVDLLASDVVMPGMSGRELAESVRRRSPGIRILYLSGYTDDAILQHGVREAIDSFLQKPFTPNQLARAVRAVLDGGGGGGGGGSGGGSGGAAAGTRGIAASRA